jgi:predicted nucleotide-binding protein
MNRQVEHPCWDLSWTVPSTETIDDLGELGILRVEPPFNKGRVFSLTVKGRKDAADLMISAANGASRLDESGAPRDRKKVAVMHGRDLEAKSWIFDWLQRVGLEPLEWNDLVRLTGQPTPYNGEAVAAAFEVAQAVVVLFTPDEIGTLHPGFRATDGHDATPAPAGQPRLNVVLEAGMAFQGHADRTVLIEIGRTREISDLAGRNTIRLDGTVAGLNSLAGRLEVAGCTVRRTGNDWLDTDALARLEALKRGVPATLPVSYGHGCAAIQPEGSAYRVFLASHNRVEERIRDEDGWSDWSEIGVLPEPIVDIAVANPGIRQIALFVLLEGGEVVHSDWNGDYGWNEQFQSLGRPFRADPVNRIAAATMGGGHREVFVETDEGSIGHIWHSKRRWHHNSDPASRLDDGWWRFK